MHGIVGTGFKTRELLAAVLERELLARLTRQRPSFAEAASLWGKCRVDVGRVTGPRGAVFTLACERAAPELRIRLAPDSDAIADWNLRVRGDGPCR